MENQQASVSLLQRRFKLGYGAAVKTMSELAVQNVIGPPNPRGDRLLQLAHYTPARFPSDGGVRHVRRLVDLSRYCVEMFEEANQLDSTAVDLIADRPPGHTTKHKPSVARAVYDAAASVLKIGLTAPVAALAQSLATKLVPLGMPPLSSVEGPLLSAECAKWDRKLERLTDNDQLTVIRKERGVRRLVRFWEQRLVDGWTSGWSRTEPFLPDSLVPIGQGTAGGKGREHVVPTQFIRDHAMDLLKAGVPADEVARWVEPFIVIVFITKDQRKAVDARWKTKMPDGWHFGSDCIYARLHLAEIDFAAPEAGPRCSCHPGAMW
jgi:hypothetical protein